MKNHDLEKNGEPPSRSRSALAKSGYRLVTLDVSLPIGDEGRKHSTNSFAQQISVREKILTTEITANCKAGNRSSDRQSAILPAPLEAECIVKTVFQGNWEPIVRAFIVSRTLHAELSASTNQNSTRKTMDLYRNMFTPAPQPRQAAVSSEAQHAPTTPGEGNNKHPPRKGPPGNGNQRVSRAENTGIRH